MSSHREAPEISKDPVADNTDLYAFVSPDAPDTVTIDRELHPAGRRRRAARTSSTSATTCSTRSTSTTTATASRTSSTSSSSRTSSATRRRSSTTRARSGRSPTRTGTAGSTTVTRIDEQRRRQACSAMDLPCPPCNIGPRSTPNYPALANAAIHTLASGVKVFAGQREEGVLRRPRVDLRPRHAAPVAEPAPGPERRRHGASTARHDSTSTHRDPAAEVEAHEGRLGVRRTRELEGRDRRLGHGQPPRCGSSDARRVDNMSSGPWVQVSRLGNPLINEVVIPMGQKDEWNRDRPRGRPRLPPVLPTRSS